MTSVETAAEIPVGELGKSALVAVDDASVVRRGSSQRQALSARRWGQTPDNHFRLTSTNEGSSTIHRPYHCLQRSEDRESEHV